MLSPPLYAPHIPRFAAKLLLFYLRFQRLSGSAVCRFRCLSRVLPSVDFAVRPGFCHPSISPFIPDSAIRRFRCLSRVLSSVNFAVRPGFCHPSISLSAPGSAACRLRCQSAQIVPISIGDTISAITAAICNTKMTGIPYTKYQCLVLWRNKCIPMIEPMLPPMIAIRNSVASGMRHSFLRAFRLSRYILKKPITLIASTYAAIQRYTLIFKLQGDIPNLLNKPFQKLPRRGNPNGRYHK